jgi:hypothetical protein
MPNKLDGKVDHESNGTAAGSAKRTAVYSRYYEAPNGRSV